MKNMKLEEATMLALQGKLEEASRMDKLQGIVNRRNQDTANAETGYINDINSLYLFVMQYQDRINEDIKLYLYATENKLMPETKLGDSWWYADGISHHIGFINNRDFRGALGMLGGGICGDVGVVYNQDKLYLYAEDSQRIVTELTDTALTTKDIGVSTESLRGFAEYCNSFKKNLVPFLDKFEKYIDEELQ